MNYKVKNFSAMNPGCYKVGSHFMLSQFNTMHCQQENWGQRSNMILVLLHRVAMIVCRCIDIILLPLMYHDTAIYCSIQSGVKTLFCVAFKRNKWVFFPLRSLMYHLGWPQCIKISLKQATICRYNISWYAIYRYGLTLYRCNLERYDTHCCISRTHYCMYCGLEKGISQHKVTSSSEACLPFPLLSYAWLKASVSHLVENSVKLEIFKISYQLVGRFYGWSEDIFGLSFA